MTLRVGGAIVLDTLAFVVWNVGTRSPLELFVAVRDAVRRRRSLSAAPDAISISAGE